MRLVFCIGVLAVCGLAFAAPVPKEKEKPSDDKVIQGTWQLTDLDAGGLAVPPDAKQLQMVFEKDKITILNKGQPRDSGGTFKLDPSAKPKAIDLKIGPNELVVGIYELDGDTLKMCISEGGMAMRPAEFKAAQQGRTMVFTMKRVADEKKDK